jgi:predicted DNA-binding protein with PD1-like motif
MRLIGILVLLCAFGSVLPAQRTKNEIVNASPTPAEDAKANSDAVPDVYSINGKFERIVTLRFKYQADLLAGLEKMVKQEKIKNAVILSAFGSVRNYHLHVVSNRTFPSKNVFIKDTNSPADIVGMSGYVTGGKLHPHIMLADSDKVFGGHLESGTNVFTFAVVTLGVLEDKADLKRLDDKSFR